MGDEMAFGALAGVRVVDAPAGVGGAMASMLLADMGAEVVCVEPLGGHALRGTPAFHVLARGKRSVLLDGDAAHGRDRLAALIATADLFLHDWPPGEDARRGFAADALRARHRRLCVGYLPAYGARGPFADLPPDEGLVQALAAIQDAQY